VCLFVREGEGEFVREGEGEFVYECVCVCVCVCVCACGVVLRGVYFKAYLVFMSVCVLFVCLRNYV